jgi:hypothetical protein
MSSVSHFHYRGVESNLRCAAIRSPLVPRTKCSQQRNRLRKVYSRSDDAVSRVYDEAGNVIETHEHGGDFKDW